VTTGTTIADALKLSREYRFDLYMLDSWLPDGSGIELCKQLREFDKATPIMFLSAAAHEIDKQAAMDSGAQRYLVKPVDIEVVNFEVDALVLANSNKRIQANGSMHNLSPMIESPDRPAHISNALNLESVGSKSFLVH
jgi:DNA-binding response OmpR family regulator